MGTINRVSLSQQQSADSALLTFQLSFCIECVFSFQKCGPISLLCTESWRSSAINRPSIVGYNPKAFHPSPIKRSTLVAHGRISKLPSTPSRSPASKWRSKGTGWSSNRPGVSAPVDILLDVRRAMIRYAVPLLILLTITSSLEVMRHIVLAVININQLPPSWN